MHIAPLAGLILLASTGTAQAATDEQLGVVEVDLLFPRNETYAPTEILPIVVGFRNPELAPLLAPSIKFSMWDLDNNTSNLVVDSSFEFKWANFSSTNGSTFYEFHPFPKSELKKEGFWELTWTLNWHNCTENTRIDQGNNRMPYNMSRSTISFTTKHGAREMDVKSIGEGCTQRQGFAFNVTGTHQLPLGADWDGGDRCGELASSVPVANPCRTEVSPAAASSISASMVSELCSRGSLLVDCSSQGEKGAAPRAAVGSIVGMMVLIGAMSQFLM